MRRLWRYGLVIILGIVDMIYAANAQTDSVYNYAEVLGKSLTFYYGQMSGKLPEWNTLNWRDDCCLEDGKDVGLDLSRSFFDCGDHVIFGHPLSFALYSLALSALHHRDAYKATGEEWLRITRILKWGTDFWIRAHPSPNVLFGQVGHGQLDHAWWGPPEFMTMPRPSFQINTTHPGSDLAASVSATFSLTYLVFREEDPLYASVLLRHAKELFDFADKYRGFYHDSIQNANGFYTSSHFEDELILGSLCLYWATKEDKYKSYAILNSRILVKKTLTWTHCWDDASYANVYLLWKLLDDSDAKFVFEQWGDFWATKIQRTPDGLAWLTGWGSLRYPLAAGFLMLCYVDSNPNIDPSRKQIWETFAISQMNYALGANNLKMSWLNGFGDKYAKHAHHRGAHGSWNNSMFDPPFNRHLNYEIIGGPALDGTFDDSITNYGQTEGGNDMQAGLVGLAAALVKRFGGAPLNNFPPPEEVGVEYMIGAFIGQSTSQSLQINTNLYGMSGWPPRTANIEIRYFINVADFLEQKMDVESMFIVDSYYNENANIPSKLRSWKNSKCLFYAQILYSKGVVYPQSTSTSRKQAQLVLRLPYNNNGQYFRRTEDWSYQTLESVEKITERICVYEDDKLVWGKEPPLTECSVPSVSPSEPSVFPTVPSIVTECSKIWQQCGGKSWKGSLCCESGLICKSQNEYYSQCIASAPTPMPPPTPSGSPVPSKISRTVRVSCQVCYS